MNLAEGRIVTGRKIMQEISVINTITVPAGMEDTAEQVRDEYVRYFEGQAGFVRSTFYKSIEKEADGSTRYVNIVVWESYEHFQSVVNRGFNNAEGENRDGYRVLGKGFPEPIAISPGRFVTLREDGPKGLDDTALD